ncbi:MAG: diguanylate cyclase [Deltaproteobacteria bacterium]|nr:diguanylate cyclase [Deltaproteobacteria bacterium]
MPTTQEDIDSQTATSSQESEKAPHILVVDDDSGVRESLQEIIRDAGYTCSTASGANEALRLLGNSPVDIVLADIRMPGMDGLTLTAIVKEKYDTDVILMTGHKEEFLYEEVIERGASDFVLKPVSSKELIARLKRVLRERALIAELKKMQSQLRELTITDDLTQLYNSRHFFRQLESEINRTRRYGRPLSLVLLDVDDFKHFNDTYGHLEGDKVLAGLSRIIQASLRKNDSAYRYGGDEFTIILPETRGRQARKVAERIRKKFRSTNIAPAQGNQVNGTISAGVAEYQLGEGVTNFAKRADQAMYTAKRQGGDQTSVA